MLDEQALRRPEFTDGHRVALGDGQEWTFPKAIVRFIPVAAPGGGVKLGQAPPYGPDYQAELETLLNGHEDTAEGRYNEVVAIMQLAAKLLLRNYDLTIEQLQTLLYYDVDGSTRPMWDAIDQIVVGLSPKPSAVGSA